MSTKAGSHNLVACPRCSFELGPRAASARGELICPFCGTAFTPAKMDDPPPAPAPPQPKTKPSPPPPPTPPVTIDDEDDDRPYALDGDDVPTMPCPECRSPVPVGAKLCVRCGLDLATGKKATRTFEPLQRRWEWGWPYDRRLALFLGLQAINGVGVVAGILAGGSIPAYLFLGGLFVGLQAFLLGTYERIELSRNAKGVVRLNRIWRACFFERSPKKIIFRGCEGIVARKEHRLRGEDWWMLIVLLGHFIVPGLIWWWLVLAPERACVGLLKDHGQTDTVLYLGLNLEQAREMAETIHEATGLPLQMNL